MADPHTPRDRAWLRTFLHLDALSSPGNIPRRDILRQEDTVLRALDMLDQGPGVVLADEVGMGKTFEALGVLAAREHQRPGSRFLVLTPGPDLNKKWSDELTRFTCDGQVFAGFPTAQRRREGVPARRLLPVEGPARGDSRGAVRPGRPRARRPRTDGRHVSGSAPLVQSEKDLLALARFRLVRALPEPEKPAAPTFEEFAVTFLDLCKANRLGVNTISHYEVHLRLYLNPVIGKRRLDAVKPADITAIKAGLTDKAQNTMCETIKTLRRVYNVAVEQGVIEHLPVKIDMPRRSRKAVVAYDAVQQAALLRAAMELGQRYVVMLLLGMDAGLRRGEMLALKWADLDFTQACMVVRHNIVRGKLDRPKGRTEDEIALTPRLAEALQAHRHPGPFVFTNDRREHFIETNIES